MRRPVAQSLDVVSESELRALLELATTSDLLELEVEQDGLRVRICRAPARGGAIASPAVSGAGAEAEQSPEEAPPFLISAPLVGVFRAHVKEGDTVAAGQVVGVVDALRMSHPVEADRAGVVEAVLVEDDHAVEYGQALVRLGEVAG